jgi:hypothetical protein
MGDIVIFHPFTKCFMYTVTPSFVRLLPVRIPEPRLVHTWCGPGMRIFPCGIVYTFKYMGLSENRAPKKIISPGSPLSLEIVILGFAPWGKQYDSM